MLEKEVKHPVVIAPFADRFDLSYLAELFQTCMTYGQYETGTILRATFPLPRTGTGLQKETVHFPRHFQLWRATLKQVRSNNMEDGKGFKMVVRLPNDGAIHREAAAHQGAALGSQVGQGIDGWHCLSEEVFDSKFDAVLAYGAEYLGGDVSQLQSRLLYHDAADRVDLEMRLVGAPEQHFCVQWERDKPDEFLRGHPSVATYVDVGFQ